MCCVMCILPKLFVKKAEKRKLTRNPWIFMVPFDCAKTRSHRGEENWRHMAVTRQRPQLQAPSLRLPFRALRAGWGPGTSSPEWHHRRLRHNGLAEVTKCWLAAPSTVSPGVPPRPPTPWSALSPDLPAHKLEPAQATK